MSLESQEGVDLTDVSWQFIPGLRSSDRKRPGAEDSSWTRYVEVASLRWS